MFFHKIDSKLLSLVKTQSSNQQVNCFVYAKNFYYAKRYLKNQFDKNLKEYPFINAFGLNISIDKILSLAKKSDITYISSVAKVFAQMDQTRKIMNIDEVQKNLDGEGVTIAIIDTGICEHLDFCSFDNRIVLFKDFVNGKEYPYDDNGHGTFVAGVIGGNGFLSGKKYQGVAPKSKIIMCKALDKNGETGATTILEAMQWIYDNHRQYNIRVVCMSFGSQPLISGDPLMLGAEALWNAGIIVVAAAGNSGPSAKTIKSPGISPKIITVGALDDGRKTGEINEKNFKLAEFSSRGPAF
ncbi:MAG: S8 family serine peptidase, partial [Christensenellales bacterium]